MATGMKMKAFFFDRKPIIEALGRANAKALSQVGAFLRTRARSSIRKRRAISAAGSAPSSHEGSLKRLLYFAFDPTKRSVVVGPEKFRQGKAPRLLEEGGDDIQQTRHGKARKVYYRPRPYMGPALAAELRAGTIPSRWANSIK